MIQKRAGSALLRSAVVLSLLALALAQLPGCGRGQKIRLTNGTGAQIQELRLETSSGEKQWTSVASGRTVSARFELSAGETIRIEWTSGSRTIAREIEMVDNIEEASEVNIRLEGEIERLHIKF